MVPSAASLTSFGFKGFGIFDNCLEISSDVGIDGRGGNDGTVGNDGAIGNDGIAGSDGFAGTEGRAGTFGIDGNAKSNLGCYWEIGFINFIKYLNVGKLLTTSTGNVDIWFTPREIKKTKIASWNMAGWFTICKKKPLKLGILKLERLKLD